MVTFSKFEKVAHVHFSSWKQSIVGVSAPWPHAIDTPTSHWHGVSSEECLGDGQPLLLEQTQKSWQCSKWWMVLLDLSLGGPKNFLLDWDPGCRLASPSWPPLTQAFLQRYTMSVRRRCVDCIGSGGGYTHYWLFSWTEMNMCDFCEFRKRTHCHKSVNKLWTRNQNVLKFCVLKAECQT